MFSTLRSTPLPKANSAFPVSAPVPRTVLDDGADVTMPVVANVSFEPNDKEEELSGLPAVVFIPGKGEYSQRVQFQVQIGLHRFMTTVQLK
jgi:hypothetical protein